MLPFFADTTSQTITTGTVDIWTEAMKGAAQWGLGIVLAILLMLIFYWFLRKSIANMQDERLMWKDLLKDSQTTLNNHLDHVQNRLESVEKTEVEHAKAFEGLGDKIVTAVQSSGHDIKVSVEHQTELLSKTLPCMRIQDKET